ncbi:hypothetical protein TUM4442_08270 [Shewanella algae]|nr:hypothetical protein TUM4442_08270 [Shewanella algae]
MAFGAIRLNGHSTDIRVNRIKTKSKTALSERSSTPSPKAGEAWAQTARAQTARAQTARVPRKDRDNKDSEDESSRERHAFWIQGGQFGRG